MLRGGARRRCLKKLSVLLNTIFLTEYSIIFALRAIIAVMKRTKAIDTKNEMESIIANSSSECW